jgi:hypothetical protein
MVAKDIDLSRYPLGQGKNLGYGATAEQPGITAGDPQPMANQFTSLHKAERGEFIADRNALMHCSVLRFIQDLCKFILTDQENIQQLCVLSLDVRELPDFLQEVLAQTLSFINQQQDFMATGIRLTKKPLKMDKEDIFSREPLAHREGIGDKIHEINGFHPGIRHPSYQHIFSEAVDKTIDQRRLASPDIACQQQKSLVLKDTVFENGQGIPVLITQPEKLRIGTDLKW